MTFSKLSNTFICLIFLLFLCGCDRAAINPFSLAPPCYDCMWTPGPCEDSPIPKELLMESASVCDDEEPCIDTDGEFTLADLVEISFTRSPLIKETWAQSRIASAQYGLAQQPFYPEIDAAAFWAIIRTPDFFGTNTLLINDFKYYGPYLTASYLLLDFGTTRYNSESLRQALLQSNWQHNREIQTLVQTVSTDYYSYITNKQKFIASEANLHDAETTLDATVKKNQAGIKDKTDVLTAKTLVSKNQSILLVDEQEMLNAKTTLIADVGLPANIDMNISDVSEQIDENLVLATMNSYVCLAYEARPDLSAAYATLLSDEWNLKAAISDQLPKLTVEGRVGHLYFTTNKTFDENNYEAVFNLNFPLFSGFYYQNQIREAKAKLALAKAQMRDVEINMVKEVVTSYQDFSIATELVKVNKEYVQNASETFEATLLSYKMGIVDITTLVNAQTNLADARFALAAAWGSWYTGLVSLTYSTGALSKPCFYE